MGSMYMFSQMSIFALTEKSMISYIVLEDFSDAYD